MKHQDHWSNPLVLTPYTSLGHHHNLQTGLNQRSIELVQTTGPLKGPGPSGALEEYDAVSRVIESESFDALGRRMGKS